ncbi:nitrile hydratase accessory protein [Roseibium hamelinense]|uniref:Nitrile hydratase accessory protein n=1 Tax=Roseibium hamelinense TaxID=150831 RepID=A0A562T783_9HYPH|nr:nitrile hydratase accessory protein [Roseibium hamelinense]TWI89431.1 nitrile hydratase accessory protein [Roseibium hamelinense]
MSTSDLLAASPAIPKDGGGPVFAEPWQARVFAMTLAAHEAGLFTWSEWAETLGAELATDPAGTAGYYDHWLAAFERLLGAKDIASEDTLKGLRAAWDSAAKATPTGEPIVLARR